MDHTLMHRPLPRFNPAPVALAVALVLSLPAMAQTQSAPDSSKVAIAIAAQPLGAALNELSAATGTPIAFPPALVAGKTAPAVKGALTAFQAVAQLLTGSGLSASQDGRTIVIRAVTNASDATLPEVKVTAASTRDGTTEGSGSYKARYTNTATKLDLSPRETPQTITVVTRQQMDDFGMTSVDDALKAASGIFVGDRGNNGSVYYSRGFELQSQYDGIPNPIGISESNRAPQIDNAFLDRVELLQGPSGLLTGAGTPGGTINLIRKRPTESFQAQTEVQLGSWNQRRLVSDVSGPLTESGRVRARLVALADDSDSFVNYAYRNRRAAYGIIEVDLTESTTLSASIQYQKDSGRNHLGVPFATNGNDPGLGRSSYFGDKNNRTEKDQTIYTLGLSQRLSEDWTLKANYTHQKTINNTYNYGFIWGDLNATTGDGLVIYRQPLLAQQIRSDALDAYLSGKVEFFGREHELAFGLNGLSMQSANQGGYGDPVAINAFTFNPGSLGAITSVGKYSGETKITQLGMYGVGRFSLSDSFKLVAGARVSNFEDMNVATNTVNTKKNGVISPYFGLIHEINKEYSIYASYSDIFNPQSYRNAEGGHLKPVVGANYEVGIKGELLNRQLNVAAAVFRLKQTNLPRLDESVAYDASNACGGSCYIAADKVISQGIDLNVSGEIGAGWNIMAGYTFVHSKYASGTQGGQRYGTQIPRHSVRLATTYKLPGTSWTIGGNLTAYDKVYVEGVLSGNSYTIRQSEFALVGLMAKYQISPQSELSFSVSNLFDRTYRAYLENRDYSPFGESRKMAINLKYRF